MQSCIILAGGESTRMGRDKRFLELDGECLLSRVVAKAREFAGHIIISLGQGEEIEESIGSGDARIVMDEMRDAGPIMGILTGLRNCEDEYCAVVPCDSPFIEPGVFRFMFSVAQGYDAIVPFVGIGERGEKKIEPLHAIYRVSSMLEACEKVLEVGKRSVRDAVEELEKVKYIPAKELKRYDEGLLTFLNLNRPEDLKKIEEVL